MSTLIEAIDGISQQTLEIVKSVLAVNERQQQFANDDSGPLAVASALNDFFGICIALEQAEQLPDAEQFSGLADYGLDLLDRLAHQRRELGIREHRDSMGLVYASLGVWFAHRNAELENLEGIADGFALLTNGLSDSAELAAMSQRMEEVVAATAESVTLDEDRDNPWRPWRVLNLNMGIAATRSLDPERMEQVFEALGRRLPYDMPGFLADGQRQMMMQSVPDPVKAVMDRHAAKWPGSRSH
jgi:hypothetical protein